jgi:hypothetical protein
MRMRVLRVLRARAAIAIARLRARAAAHAADVARVCCAATERELIAAMTALRRATKISPQKSQLTFVYLSMVASGAVPPCPSLRALLVKKQSKSQSGVLVRTQRAFCPIPRPKPYAAAARTQTLSHTHSRLICALR